MSKRGLSILSHQNMDAKDLNPFYKPKWLRFILINLGIAIVISFLFCTECYSSWDRLDDALGGILYSFCLSSILSWGLGAITSYNTKKLSWINAPFKRFVLEIIAVTAYASFASFVVIFTFHWVFGHFTLNNIPWDYLLRNVKYPLFIAYGITAFFRSRSFLMEWRQTAVDAERLRTEQFAGKYKTLKDQLNPHFLFNSLNVLSNVVYDDQDKAVDFIQHLSRFYRYVLEVQQEEVVTLERELDFGKRYLLLQQLRFGENLRIEMDVETSEGELLPPLSLQLLLENAIKHNEVSNENPLNITLSKLDNHLLVQNNINPKSVDEESTGVGLKNIKERYELLSDREVRITNNGDHFTVKLPLLNL